MEYFVDVEVSLT